MIRSNKIQLKSGLLALITLSLIAGCTVPTSSSLTEEGLLTSSKLQEFQVRKYDLTEKKIIQGSSYEEVKTVLGADCLTSTVDLDDKVMYCDYEEEGRKDQSLKNKLGLVFTKLEDESYELTFMAYEGPDLPTVDSTPEAINRNVYKTYTFSKEIYPTLDIGTDIFVDKSAYATLQNDAGQTGIQATIDGDTSYFKVAGSYTYTNDPNEVPKFEEKIETTRFMGIDAAETHHPTLGIQPWGTAGKQYAGARQAEATNVVLQLDKQGARETYGRLLAYIWLDGILYNLEALEMGLAAPRYESNNTYTSQLVQVFFTRDEWQKVTNLTDPNWNYSSPNFNNNACKAGDCELTSDYLYKFTYGLTNE